MKRKIFTLLTLALCAVTGAWGSNTTLIDGITLPDVPESTIDMSSQTDFTANAYGWIVFNPYASLGSKTYWSNNSGNKTGTTWTVPDGAHAPFVGSASSVNVHTLRNNRTYALRFTGAEAVSFLVKAAASNKKAIVSLYSYNGTHTAVGSAHECTSTNATEIYINGLSTSTTYIAYIYSNDSGSNSFVMEIGIKKPVTTYTVTYKANGGTGDDVVDDAAAAVADCPNTFTAPSGKAFTGWNTQADGLGTAYAVGAAIASNLTLYAQWAASHSVTYSLGAATGGTLPTQDNVAEGATFEVAAVPGDLVAPAGKEFKCWNDGTTDYAPGATYTMSTSNVTLTAVYQDRTYKGLTPTTVMDFDNPGTMFTSVWTTGNNLKQNFYFDAPNGVAAFSAFALYQAKNNSKISWMVSDNTSSTDDTWSASGSFKGNSYYFSSSSKAATVRATERMHYYRVKGITGASALMGNKAKMEAYLVTAGVVSADPVANHSITEAGTLSITGLNTANEYIIKVYGDNGNSNVQFREIAFTFTAVTSVSSTIGATSWSTYSSAYALDFANATPAGLSAYMVTGFSGTALTRSDALNNAPAGTGLLLNGTAGQTYTIPVLASSSTVTTSNKMVASVTGGTVAAGTGSTVNYVLMNNNGTPEFQWIGANSATLGANKAYLALEGGPKPGASAPGLWFDFGNDGETTGINAVKGAEFKVNGEYYNLAGQRVAQPTKGLYIVNGKKVVIK